MCIRDRVIENKAIINMPLNGRAFWQLAQLTPGVVFTPGGSDISSGGQGIRATRVGLRISGSSRLAGGWFLDGFDITEYELGATSITPSTDAIEEFKVLGLSLIHISEPTRLLSISYAVFCL